MWRSHKVELLLGLLVLGIVGPVVQRDATQQASRYALTAAIVEERTFVLDDYVGVLGADRVFYNGHTYSDKAPGEPVLAVPFYALYRWVGGEPGTVFRVEGNLGLWWLTFWFAMLPAAGLAMLMYRATLRLAPESALPVALGMAFATMLLPFSTLLFGHVLAAFLGFSAYLLFAKDPSSLRVLLAGGLLGLAVSVEYTMVILAVVAVGHVAWRSRSKIGWLVLGGAPFAALLAAYNWVAFGSPLVLSYQVSAFGGAVADPRSIGGIFSGIHPIRLAELFLAPRGFVVATPLVVVGLIGVALMIRHPSLRADGLVSAVVFVGFLAVPLMWSNPWGGSSPGPRYMVPALPFLAAPLARVWRRVPLLSALAVGTGILTMALATFTYPLLPRAVGFGLGTWMRLALDGEWTTTLYTMWIGGWGWVLHASTVIALAFALRAAQRNSMSLAGLTS